MSNQRYLMSHASLMAALLEHAGHLSEAVSQLTGNESSFPKCIRYVVYTFFNSKPDDLYIQDIEKSAVLHQKHLLQNISEPHSAFKSPSWITQIYRSTQKQSMTVNTITHIDSTWQAWNPDEDIGKIMKRSINEIL